MAHRDGGRVSICVHRLRWRLGSLRRAKRGYRPGTESLKHSELFATILKSRTLVTGIRAAHRGILQRGDIAVQQTLTQWVRLSRVAGVLLVQV